MSRCLLPLVGLLGVVLGGCRGRQAVLDPAGMQAEEISQLGTFFFVLGTVVLVLVVVFLVLAVLRGRRRAREEGEQAPEVEPSPAGERRLTVAVGASVAATVLVLLTLLLVDLFTGRTIRVLLDPNPLTVIVTGNQWWWQVQYEDRDPSRMLTTANEIHIPVGRPVRFRLRSNDVIHSFWAPNFHGKKDLVPGHPTTTWFRATRAGTFYGQCAEFCGTQHAHMRFVIVAEPQEQFEAWYRAQLQPARTPATPRQRRGQEVFLGSTCVMCHTIQGTPARGRVGPDLTHLAGRMTLAAASRPNTRGHRAGWIIDSHAIKPGNRMPPIPLTDEDLQALLAYLDTLR
ncbi:MAG TPA: cytochrome c oxidase subunit II [Rubricoccaceae bacterium]|nr:cytochrome c oxidase subunit II [Rubricoccaceae bacterium]